jgi:protein phosphatase
VTAIQVANSRIYQESLNNDEHQGMGTTVVAVHAVGGHQTGHIAHVGDSRCYRFRAGRLELMTMDHSLVNDYLRAAPDLSEEQLAELPRNVITRALGMQDSVAVDVQSIELAVGDILLLCSDGLSGMVTDAESQEIIEAQRADLAQTAAALVEHANEQGGEDNSTVVLIEVAEE